MIIQTNANIPEKFLKDVCFGVTFDEDAETNIKFTKTKLISFIKKIIPEVDTKNPELKSILFISSLLKKTMGLTKEEFFKDLLVQINIPNQLTGIGKNISWLLANFRLQNISDKLERVSITNGAFSIVGWDKQIVFLGTEHMSNGDLGKNLVSNLGLKTVTALIVLHELAHVVENKIENELCKERISSNEKLGELCKFLKIQEDIKIKKETRKLVDEIHALHIESYADITSLLWYKELLLKSKKFSEDFFLNIVSGLMETREKIFVNNIGDTKYNYATFFAIRDLFSPKILGLTKLSSSDAIDYKSIHEVAYCCSDSAIKTMIGLKIKKNMQETISALHEISMFRVEGKEGILVHSELPDVERVSKWVSKPKNKIQQGYTNNNSNKYQFL